LELNRSVPELGVIGNVECKIDVVFENALRS
jgi:hypothetical protein